MDAWEGFERIVRQSVLGPRRPVARDLGPGRNGREHAEGEDHHEENDKGISPSVAAL